MASLLALKHISCEGPGRLGPFAAEKGVHLDIIDLEHGDPLPDWRPYEGLVVLGGPMNVYEEEKHPYLKAETATIREAVTAGKPFLGLCLGGQLLAKAVGGRVAKNPVKEIGNFEITLTAAGKADPFFTGFPETFPVLQWHGDTFSDLGGGTLLASSTACAHQAFRWGDKAYGLQFHVEISLEMAREWFHEYNVEVAEEKLDPVGILQEFARRESAYADLSRRLFENFFRIASL